MIDKRAQMLNQLIEEKLFICNDCGQTKCEFCWNVKRAIGRIFFFLLKNIKISLKDQGILDMVISQITENRPAVSWEQLILLEQMMIKYNDYGDDLVQWRGDL